MLFVSCIGINTILYDVALLLLRISTSIYVIALWVSRSFQMFRVTLSMDVHAFGSFYVSAVSHNLSRHRVYVSGGVSQAQCTDRLSEGVGGHRKSCNCVVLNLYGASDYTLIIVTYVSHCGATFWLICLHALKHVYCSFACMHACMHALCARSSTT